MCLLYFSPLTIWDLRIRGSVEELRMCGSPLFGGQPNDRLNYRNGVTVQ
jgi:hypothetical protein